MSDNTTTTMSAAMRDAFARLNPEARERLLASTVAAASDDTTPTTPPDNGDNGADDGQDGPT